MGNRLRKGKDEVREGGHENHEISKLQEQPSGALNTTLERHKRFPTPGA
jgi:hypothetical protein